MPPTYLREPDGSFWRGQIHRAAGFRRAPNWLFCRRVTGMTSASVKPLRPVAERVPLHLFTVAWAHQNDRDAFRAALEIGFGDCFADVIRQISRSTATCRSLTGGQWPRYMANFYLRVSVLERADGNKPCDSQRPRSAQ